MPIAKVTHVVGYDPEAGLSIEETQRVIDGLCDEAKELQEGESNGRFYLIYPADHPDELGKRISVIANNVGIMEAVATDHLPLEGSRETINRNISMLARTVLGEWATEEDKVAMLAPLDTTAELFEGTDPQLIHAGQVYRLDEPIPEDPDVPTSGESIPLLNKAVPTEQTELPPTKDYSGEIEDEGVKERRYKRD
ncbi:MAG TPA: hypothetical protein VD947_01820 [Patescibacteria group bacterium]|nr:hypothetical protein [Patescibacteria group bacterium]